MFCVFFRMKNSLLLQFYKQNTSEFLSYLTRSFSSIISIIPLHKFLKITLDLLYFSIFLIFRTYFRTETIFRTALPFLFQKRSKKGFVVRNDFL